MVVNGAITGRFFLILTRIRIPLFLTVAMTLLHAQLAAQEAPDRPASHAVNRFLLKNFVKSLILPGWGQWENGNKTRAILYVTAELAGIYGYQSNHAAGYDKEVEFKAYGDAHWDYTVWSFSDNGQTACGNLRTHEMPTYMDDNGNTQPVRDHHFYENISKYPEFVCGWDDWDPNGEFADEDLSPHKINYVDMRTRSNELYRHAQVAGTLIMINHLISAFDAALSTDITSFESGRSTGKLYINPLNVARGISLEVKF